MSAVLEQFEGELRLMCYEDLPIVMEIEKRAYPFPWSRGIFSDCIRVGYLCWVYEESDEVLAYGVMSIVLNECHLLNLCVKPEVQGQGIGRKVLRHMLDIAQGYQADIATLEVRPSNRRAIRLYAAEGFTEVGNRKDYYPAHYGREDAIIFAKNL